MFIRFERRIVEKNDSLLCTEMKWWTRYLTRKHKFLLSVQGVVFQGSQANLSTMHKSQWSRLGMPQTLTKFKCGWKIHFSRVTKLIVLQKTMCGWNWKWTCNGKRLQSPSFFLRLVIQPSKNPPFPKVTEMKREGKVSHYQYLRDRFHSADQKTKITICNTVLPESWNDDP